MNIAADINDHVDRPVSAERKASLLHEALNTLKLAKEIDDQDSLLTDWVSWYDATIRDCTDIEKIVGAIRIELATRRGNFILAEGEKRGGNRKSGEQSYKVGNFDSTQRRLRFQDRLIASAPDVIKEYVRHARKPSINGAVQAAHTAKATVSAKVSRKIHKTSKPAPPPKPPKPHQSQIWLDQIKKLANSIPLPIIQAGSHRTLPGLPQTFEPLTALEFCPWIRIERTSTHITLHLNQTLRDICLAEQEHSELGGLSVSAWQHQLRDEIAQRNQANYDAIPNKDWVSEYQKLAPLIDLLNWIEDQLDRKPFLPNLRDKIRTARSTYHAAMSRKDVTWIHERANLQKHIALFEWILAKLDQIPSSYETEVAPAISY